VEGPHHSPRFRTSQVLSRVLSGRLFVQLSFDIDVEQAFQSHHQKLRWLFFERRSLCEFPVESMHMDSLLGGGTGELQLHQVEESRSNVGLHS
jgi:hypothetical protein